ncbi:MAG: NADH-quinone oxidoreductase subunit M, partial [bacterium]
MITLILLTLPVIAALATWYAPNGKAKNVALAFTLAELGVALYAMSQHVADSSSQFVFDRSWISSLGIRFKIGMDGISLLLVLLTTFLYPLIVLSTSKRAIKNENTFYALMLFMQAGLIG